MPDSDGRRIRAVETTLRIVEALQDRERAGVTELASAVGASKTTVFNHLATLRANRYVVKDDDDRYRLGLRFLETAHATKSRFEMYDQAEGEVDRLAERTGEMAMYGGADRDTVYTLKITCGDQAIQTPFYEGYPAPLHSTAAGKAILAFRPESALDEYVAHHGLGRVTETTITDPGDLRDELEAVRKTGVAFNREENIPGLVGAGAPIKRQDGTVAGAISIIGPESRFSTERLETELPELLRKSANIIELNSTLP